MSTLTLNLRETARDVITRLMQERDALPADEDFLGTPRECADLYTRRATLGRRIGVLRNAPNTLTELAPKVEEAEHWLADITRWRDALATELLAGDPNSRMSRDRGRQQNLMLSIRCIDLGTGVLFRSGYALGTLRLGELMRADGYTATPPAPGQMFGELPWFGATPEVEHRLKVLHARRADAEAQIAEALLDDETRAARDNAKREHAIATNEASRAARAPGGASV